MNVIARVIHKIRTVVCRYRRIDEIAMLPIYLRHDLERLGGTCGWVVPASLLPRGSVCYCVGVGEDITFDIALAAHLGCDVFSFDPTPRAIAYIASITAGLPPRLTFHPWGVWERDEKMRFYAPRNHRHVSHSILNLQKTERFFEADCKRIDTIMRELGHSTLSLLKLDIEGAEYAVIESMLNGEIRPRVLAVEFDEIHTPKDGGSHDRITKMIRRITRIGYKLVCADGPNYTFVYDSRLCT